MNLRLDVVSALRSLRKSPGFTFFSILVLAAGIGLTLYMFGAINGFVLRPLPYRDAGRLVHFELSNPSLEEESLAVPYPDYLELRPNLGGLTDVAAFYEGTLNLSDSGDPERFSGVFASGDLFGVLGERAILGRGLTAADSAPGAPAVVVLSEVVWERRYGRDPGVVGRAVRLNGRPATVVGVMPASFRFPIATEAWTSIPARMANLSWQDAIGVEVIGHLAPGSSMATVRAELDAALQRQEAVDSSRPGGRRAVIKPLAEEWVSPQTRRTIGTMFVAVLLVLFISCANVANLLYARGVGRRRHMAVRAALGASRRRLIVHGLTESCVVALAAAAIGLPLAERAGAWTMELLRTKADMDIPSWVRFDTDARGLLFTLFVAVVSAVAAGLIPALSGSRVDVQTELGAAGRSAVARGSRSLRILVVAQIALSCGLVICAGLAARSVGKLADAELGVDSERILGGRVALFEESYPDDASSLDFYARAEQSLRELPGVEAATVTTSLPGTFASYARVEVEGSELDPRRTLSQTASTSPTYFEAMGVELVAGRGFRASDDAEGEPVAIVNQRFAERYLAGSDPIGRRLRFHSQDGSNPWLRIVGVAPDLDQAGLDDPTRPACYLPIAQSTPRYAFLALRSTGDAGALRQSLAKSVAAIDPDQPVYYLRTLEEWNTVERWSNRFMATLFVTFAFAGLLLASIGVYGMTAYAVAQRTPEIGVRRVLGALDSSVVTLVARRSLLDLAWGLGVGLLLAVVLARQVAGILYGVDSFDLPTFAVVPLVLLLAVAAATLSPVRRALAIEPATALRQE